MTHERVAYGMVGMGPVGVSLASRIRATGRDVITYDVEPARCEGFPAAGGLKDLAASCDWLQVAVPSSATGAVVSEVAGALRPGALLIDWSSSAPARKVAFAEQVGAARFVDVALLDSITADPPLVGAAGLQAEAVVELLSDLGFDARLAGEEPGHAATAKMIRSLFMKPLEVIAIEALRTERAHRATSVAMDSIERTLRQPFGEIATMLLETNRLHAARRADELDQVMAEIALADFHPFLNAASGRLRELDAVWARPEAPPKEAGAEALAAFLAQSQPNGGVS